MSCGAEKGNGIMTKVTVDKLAGRRARIVRTVTALRPTSGWTGTCIWDGTLTDAHRDPVTGELSGVCIRTASEHTWIALGDSYDRVGADLILPASPEKAERRWSTRIELADGDGTGR